MKKNLYLMAVAAIVAGCSSEDSAQMQEPAGKPSASELQQLVFGTAGTRAHWEDGDTKLTFAWDADNVGTELVCAIASEGAFAPGYKVTGNEVGEAEYASYLTIMPNVEDTGLATFTTVNSFRRDAGLTGQTLYAVTPVAKDKVTATANGFSVAMEMPNTFTQTASGDLTHLKPYMQMYATATLTEGDNNLTFSHIPTTIGFNIVNSGTTAVTVKSVTIDAVEADGILPSPLASAEITLSNTSFAPASSAVNYFSQITTLLGADGTEIAVGGNYTAYALALPLASDMAADATLRIKVTTTDGTFILKKITVAEFNTQTGLSNWSNGKFVGFKVDLSELPDLSDAPEEHLLQAGEDFNSLIQTTLQLDACLLCTKIKFVTNSEAYEEGTDSLFYTDGEGVSSYWTVNGNCFEIHTEAKKFTANESCSTMFYGSGDASALPLNNRITAIDFGENFDTQNVTSFYRMFYCCKSLESLDVRSFNTSKATTMQQMFDNCLKLTAIDLTGFNTDNVTTMRQMFYCCEALTNLDLSSFNTAKVTDMYRLFRSCSKLNTLDISNFDFTSTTNQSDMFRSTNNIKNIYVNRAGYEFIKTKSLKATTYLYDKETGTAWDTIIAAEGETTE